MTENENKKSLLREIIDFAEILIVTLFCVSLIFTYLLSIVTVDGDSMEETLFSDERVLVSQVSRHPEAGVYSASLHHHQAARRPAGKRPDRRDPVRDTVYR